MKISTSAAFSFWFWLTSCSYRSTRDLLLAMRPCGLLLIHSSSRASAFWRLDACFSSTSRRAFFCCSQPV